MCPGTTTVKCNDVSITNNKIQGSFNEDQIQANLYHDGPDADPYGLLVEGNEFLGNVEWGNHDDVFQSVWGGDNLYFRKNYLHDFGGQGFFVKDQPSAIDGLVFDDNLIVRQNLPCDPTSLCPTWQLAAVQIFGPVKNVSIRHNTVWPGTAAGSRGCAARAGPARRCSPTTFRQPQLRRERPDDRLQRANNTYCGGSGMPSAGLTSDCNPAFDDANDSDLRQANGAASTGAWPTSSTARARAPHSPRHDRARYDDRLGPRRPDRRREPGVRVHATEPGAASSAAGRLRPGRMHQALRRRRPRYGATRSPCARSDAAGNTDASPATWIVHGLTPPRRTRRSLGPGALSLSGSGSVGFTVSESADALSVPPRQRRVERMLQPRPGVSPWPGPLTSSATRSLDAAGNVEFLGASAGGDLVLPLTPPAAAAPAGPTVTLTAPAADATVGRTARFAAYCATSRGPISRVEFWVDSRRLAADRRVPYVAMVDRRVGARMHAHGDRPRLRQHGPRGIDRGPGAGLADRRRAHARRRLEQRWWGDEAVQRGRRRRRDPARGPGSRPSDARRDPHPLRRPQGQRRRPRPTARRRSRTAERHARARGPVRAVPVAALVATIQGGARTRWTGRPRPAVCRRRPFSAL